jgi:hypothetical protein
MVLRADAWIDRVRAAEPGHGRPVEPRQALAAADVAPQAIWPTGDPIAGRCVGFHAQIVPKC